MERPTSVDRPVEFDTDQQRLLARDFEVGDGGGEATSATSVSRHDRSPSAAVPDRVSRIGKVHSGQAGIETPCQR